MSQASAPAETRADAPGGPGERQGGYLTTYLRHGLGRPRDPRLGGLCSAKASPSLQGRPCHVGCPGWQPRLASSLPQEPRGKGREHSRRHPRRGGLPQSSTHMQLKSGVGQRWQRWEVKRSQLSSGRVSAHGLWCHKPAVTHSHASPQLGPVLPRNRTETPGKQLLSRGQRCGILGKGAACDACNPDGRRFKSRCSTSHPAPHQMAREKQ